MARVGIGDSIPWSAIGLGPNAQFPARAGDVQISSGNHVWMADRPRAPKRASWIASLDDMLARNPDIAISGHLPPGAPTGIAAIAFTRNYILAFEDELARAHNGATLIMAIKQRYPDLAMDFILDLGAHVCMGEQQWP